jgi:hypothetical protein
MQQCILITTKADQATLATDRLWGFPINLSATTVNNIDPAHAINSRTWGSKHVHRATLRRVSPGTCVEITVVVRWLTCY